jgi:Glutaminase
MLDANKLQQAVDQAYTQFHSLNGGQNADYIPFLANVPGQLAAVAIVTCDGNVYSAGEVITALRWNPSRKSVR